jgi:hypothetical protein
VKLCHVSRHQPTKQLQQNRGNQTISTLEESYSDSHWGRRHWNSLTHAPCGDRGGSDSTWGMGVQPTLMSSYKIKLCVQPSGFMVRSEGHGPKAMVGLPIGQGRAAAPPNLPAEYSRPSCSGIIAEEPIDR